MLRNTKGCRRCQKKSKEETVGRELSHGSERCPRRFVGKGYVRGSEPPRSWFELNLILPEPAKTVVSRSGFATRVRMNLAASRDIGVSEKKETVNIKTTASDMARWLIKSKNCQPEYEA